MRARTVLVAGLLAVLLVAGALPAGAVVWGEPDGDAHPQVGLLAFDVDGVPSHGCSGTLLSPTVVLTAGHCTWGTSGARVWFESEITDPAFPAGGGSAIEGTAYTHPDFDNFASSPNTSDLGVVVLDQPVHGVAYAALPEIGALDHIDQRRGHHEQSFEIVGYGLQSVVPVERADLVRHRATPRLQNLRNALTDGWSLQLSVNAGTRNPGGACFGDSGGPAFVGDSLVLAGVSSLVSRNCVGTSWYYRVDTEHAQRFVTAFLGG